MLPLVGALTFGLIIVQSVVEEKQSRVVEILAAAVPIRVLLTGKVPGNAALALTQVPAGGLRRAVLTLPRSTGQVRTGWAVATSSTTSTTLRSDVISAP